MVSLYVTAIGYLIGGHSAAEVYELLKGQGYLSERGLSERAQLISMIEQVRKAFPTNPDLGQEPWRDVDAALGRAGYLSPKGLSEGRRFVTRDGSET